MAPTSHARLSPSSASRWSRCPGSVNFIDDLDEPDDGSEAADEGTVLHSFMETCLRENIEAYDLIGEQRSHNGVKVRIDDEIADMLQSGLDEIDRIPGRLFVETRVDLARWMPGQFGTLDVGIIGKKWVTIWDHKFGYVPVSPVKNDQERIYALGFWDRYLRGVRNAPTKFRLIIWQPRSGSGGGEWETDIDELLDFGDWIRKRAAMTYGRNAKRIAGPKQCAYCPGAKTLTCEVYNEFNRSQIIDDFEADDELARMGLAPRLRRPYELSPEELCRIVENRPMIDKWLDRLHALALDNALKGHPTPGLKAIEGRAPKRKWADEVKAEERLKRLLADDAYTRKLLSVAKAEKALPASIYAKLKDEELIDFGIPKPILVPEQDARPAMKTIVEELFFDD